MKDMMVIAAMIANFLGLSLASANYYSPMFLTGVGRAIPGSPVCVALLALAQAKDFSGREMLIAGAIELSLVLSIQFLVWLLVEKR